MKNKEVDIPKWLNDFAREKEMEEQVRKEEEEKKQRLEKEKEERLRKEEEKTQRLAKLVAFKEKQAIPEGVFAQLVEFESREYTPGKQFKLEPIKSPAFLKPETVFYTQHLKPPETLVPSRHETLCAPASTPLKAFDKKTLLDVLSKCTGSCALCMFDRTPDYLKAVPLRSKYDMEFERRYSFSLPDGLKIPLCSRHAEQVESALKSASKPSPKGISLLKAGECDLVEAAKYDPNSNHIKKNLRDVREILAKLGETSSSSTKTSQNEATVSNRSVSNKAKRSSKASKHKPTTNNTIPDVGTKKRQILYSAFLTASLILAMLTIFGNFFIMIGKQLPFLPVWIPSWGGSLAGNLAVILGIVVTITSIMFMGYSFQNDSTKLTWIEFCDKPWAEKNNFYKSIEIIFYIFFLLSLLARIG